MEEYIPYSLHDHPDTRNKIRNIQNDKLVQEITSEYEVIKQETQKNVTQLKGGMSSDEIIDKMILPDEAYKSTESLFIQNLTKHDSQTGTVYESRYGVNIILTNKRAILTDVDRDDTPQMIKNHKKNGFIDMENWKIGHVISESLYFQPINFSNIFSVSVDVKNHAEASRVINMKRHMIAMIAGVILALMGFFTNGTMSLLLFSIGGIVAIVGYAVLKIMEKEPPYVENTQIRSITLGLIDPATLKRAYWILNLPIDIHPDYMVEWASVVQRKIYEVHGAQKVNYSMNY